ncbi:hypothetical protein DNTS_026159 [Danionella cerebrum]|uniref:B30.2/SPRY domain-containing protein n=1 Tax=Danionella cerebrum TaxID=2873325 RepID=A0A553QZW9_9TELE|nr:hypothetical protein DNTS_026159 [Danionella translucida]
MAYAYPNPDLNSSGSAHVECSSCIRGKRKAEQTCMECLESYCEFHLELHNTLHVGKRHKLVEPKTTHQKNICPDHGRMLDVYCRTDQQCICHLCITEKHTGHIVIAIEEELVHKKIKLQELQKKTVEITSAKEKDLHELKQAIEVFKASANNALEKNEKSFTKLMQNMRENQSKVTTLIQGQTEIAVKQAEGIIKTIQKQICVLRTSYADLQQMELFSQTHNAVCFLEVYSAVSLPLLAGYKETFVFHAHPYNSFERDSMAVDELIDKLNTTSQLSLFTISRKAHECLLFRNDNHEVQASNLLQGYPEHTERFSCRAQIICNEAFRGSPKYWEVELGGGTWICIAVSYKGIRRKGKAQTLLGRNTHSWGLRCFASQFEFWHDNKTMVTVNRSNKGSKIGVYLDYRAGILAFYNVSGDNTSLIYKHQTAFKEPVYPAFGLAGKSSYVRLCNTVISQAKTL